jgi:hypothetical protein
MFIEQLPVPISTKENVLKIEEFVNIIDEFFKDENKERISKNESILNQYIYNLYDLTEDEIKFIENYSL